MLSGPYLRATDKFLRDNGVDPDAVEKVMQLLAGFAEPEGEAAEDGGPDYARRFSGRAAQDALRRVKSRKTLVCRLS